MTRKTALVTGSSSGLGKAIAEMLPRVGYRVVPYDIEDGYDVRRPELPPAAFRDDFAVLVNCAGVNGINWLADVDESDWDRIMDVNAKGAFMMSQACAPQLRDNKGTILNIVSNAAHMPMRCSAAYNASKAAALMLTKQLARELSPDVTVFSISPNKLAGTGMSRQIDQEVVRTRGWTLDQARDYQLNGLLTKAETPPQEVAEFIAFLLSSKSRHKYLAGCDIPYGA
jgi:NAD(P)-dependent dehydrogenase (short-subunit alcohol dehydrogenase family)